MPGEIDNISALLGGQAPIDESEIDELEGSGSQDGGDEPPAASSEPPAGDEPPAPSGRQKRVPLAALQEERTHRQELQDKLTSNEQRYAQLEQRTNMLLEQFARQQQFAQQQQQQAQQPTPAQIPNFVDDPEGHVRALTEQFQAQIQQLQQQNQAYQSQGQQAAQNQQLASWASGHEETFKAATPDYNAAADYFYRRKQAEYSALGADPVSIQAQIARDYQSLVVGAYQTNRNPAQLLYGLATAMGYQKQAPTQQKPGQQRQPVKQPPTSLSNVEGVSRAPDEEGELTVEGLANMSDAEFDKLYAKMARGSRQVPRY